MRYFCQIGSLPPPPSLHPSIHPSILASLTRPSLNPYQPSSLPLSLPPSLSPSLGRESSDVFFPLVTLVSMISRVVNAANYFANTFPCSRWQSNSNILVIDELKILDRLWSNKVFCTPGAVSPETCSACPAGTYSSAPGLCDGTLPIQNLALLNHEFFLKSWCNGEWSWRQDVNFVKIKCLNITLTGKAWTGFNLQSVCWHVVLWNDRQPRILKRRKLISLLTVLSRKISDRNRYEFPD